ncbi:hypothetical protein C1A38_25795 [Verrucosispora sp. ts21]|nr:hypothetical protein C1A38_25795 [Verrucosispora sp. ts21]
MGRHHQPRYDTTVDPVRRHHQPRCIATVATVDPGATWTTGWGTPPGGNPGFSGGLQPLRTRMGACAL